MPNGRVGSNPTTSTMGVTQNLVLQLTLNQSPNGLAGSNPATPTINAGVAELGRRAGFKPQCHTTCGFDSHHPHQGSEAEMVQASG